MIIFLDSSALVKRYIAEAGTDNVVTLLKEAEYIFVSWLAYPETLAAITRRSKGADLDKEALGLVKQQFAADWKLCSIVEVSGESLKDVVMVIEKHALRGADSVHLAAALWLKRSVGLDLVFVASDEELLRAADRERLKTLNPSHVGANGAIGI